MHERHAYLALHLEERRSGLFKRSDILFYATKPRSLRLELRQNVSGSGVVPWSRNGVYLRISMVLCVVWGTYKDLGQYETFSEERRCGRRTMLLLRTGQDMIPTRKWLATELLAARVTANGQ
ncbi:MAG: hypothetical protein M1834_002867 [Cirrosporium novae-zelandiae]|nr:MAG: hypothetical protein M1834_002867 [Cirrosporium novae-zelandiae]